MNIRVKYTKTGPVKFISHLDVMRYFQKGIRRAGLDIAYSGGFSPHQIISFAAPMPLMMTSLGEYFDAEFNSVTTAKEMVESFNAVGSPFMQMVDAVILPDKAEKAMALVSASDYKITFHSDVIESVDFDKLRETISEMIASEEILALKKTKKSENYVNIRGSIRELSLTENREIYMLLNAGSVDNLKPELVMEVISERMGLGLTRFGYDLERIETYLTKEDGSLASLLSEGQPF